MPSFGREVKHFVSCHRFSARKRTLLDYVEFEQKGSSDRVGSRVLRRSARTLEQHGHPLEMKGGNQSDAVHNGPV
jgi:hypothetical protein